MLEEETIRVAAVIPLNFWTDQEQVKDTGEFVTVDYVEWQKKGDPRHCGGGKIRVIQKHEPAVWEALKPAYEAWKKGEDAPVNGTPIDVWPPVTKRMAQHLKMQGLRTVEDIAGATDADLERMGMGGVSLREKARTYISLKGGAQSASMLADRDKRIEALETQLKEALEVIKDLPKKKKKEA